MGTTIDERVVQMRFDNRQFEAHAKQSMSTLDRLKEKLNFKGAVKGIEEVSMAAEKVSLSSLGDSADKVSLQFDALAVVAVTALSRITNAAITTGTNLVKSMSVDQVTAGFGKYEQKVQSVQTIMNATGKSIEEVEYELSKLIWFTDETSYSFSDMVNNVGKFTSNQIDLRVAVRDMMGIANAAGLAGASVNDASHAMDGFSKAMAQGYMTRQNWQWIKTAHMDTAEFKKQLIEAAVAVGTLKKAGDGAYKTLKGSTVTVANFEEGMKDAWINTNVMIKALDRFGGTAEDLFNYVEANGGLASDAIAAIGDQLDEVGIKAFKASQEAKTFSDAINATKDAVSTGWMETFDILFGNYEEAKELWTALTEELYDIFAEGGNARNDILREWKELGGRDTALEGISAAWINLKEIIGTVKQAIHSVFPVDWVSLLTSISNKIKSFGEGLKLSEEALYGLGEGVKLVLIPVQAVVQVGRIGLRVIENLVPMIWKLVDAVLSLPSKLGNVETALRRVFGDERYERIATALNKVVQRLGVAFASLVEHVKNVIDGFKNLGNTKFGEEFQRLGEILRPIAEWILDRIVAGIEAIANADYSKITEWASKGLSFVIDRLQDIKKVAGISIMSVIDFFKKLELTKPADFFNAVVSSVTNLKNTIQTMIKGFSNNTITESIKNETSGITTVINSLAKALQELVSRLTPAKILVFGFGVTLTTVMLNVSKALDSFSKIATAASNTISNFGGVFKALQDRIKPNKIQQIAVALLLLAGAIVAMSLVPADRLEAATKAMGAMMVGLVAMVGAFALIQKVLLRGDKIGSVLNELSRLMLVVAGSVMILAVAMTTLQKVNLENVIGPLVAVIATMAGLSVAISVLATLTKGDLPKNALTLVAFAVAIKIVANSLAELGNVKLGSVVPNLLIMSGAIVAIASMSRLAGKLSFKGTAGITLVIADLLLFATVLKKLSTINSTEIIKGILSYMGIITSLIPLFLLCRVTGEGAKDVAKTMLYVSAAMVVLQLAIRKIAELSLGEVVKGTAAVSALIGMFTLLSKASWLVGKESGSMGKSFIAMGAAILLLSVAIDYLGHLDLNAAVQGGVVVSAILLIFAQIMKSSKDISKATGTISALVAAIGVLTASIMLLTLVPFEEALQSVIILGSILLAFGGTMKLVQGIDWKNGVGAALTIGSIIGAFAVAFIVMKDIDGKTMMQKAISLSSVMVALGVTMRAISGLSGNVKTSLTNILGTVSILAAASAILAILNVIPFNEGLIEKAGSLAIIMATLSGVMYILGSIKTSGSDTLKNAASFAIVATAIVGLVGSIGLIANAFDSEGVFVDSGITILARMTSIIPIILAIAGITALLGTFSSAAEAAGKGAIGFAKVALIVIGVITGIGAIGAAIDALTGGAGVSAILDSANTIYTGLAEIMGGALSKLVSSFGTGITGGLKQMGQDLSDFAANASGFFVAMSSMNQNILDGVVKMVEMMLHLSRIPDVKYYKMLPEFGDQLNKFAPKFVEFADQIKDIPVDSTLAAGECLVGLAELISAIPAEGGLWQDLFGGRDFGKFGEGLKGFAEGFKTYCEVIETANITEQSVNATKYATDALIELAKKVPESGGVLQSFFGEHDIAKFGTDLAIFGSGLVEFFSIITGQAEGGVTIDFEIVRACASAGEALANFAQKIPEAGGTLQQFFGSKDIGVFGAQLLLFGQSLVDFFKLFVGENAVAIDQTLVDACVTAGEAFASFSEKIPRMGSAFEWFTGKRDMGEFGTQIREFGEGLAGFFTSFKAVNVTDSDVEIANTAMEGFASLSQAIGKTGGISQAWSSSSLEEYGKQVKKLGEYLSKYYENISDIDFYKVNVSIAAAQNILSLNDGLEETGFSVVEKIRQILNDIVASANEVLDINGTYSFRFYEIGKYIINGLKQGMAAETDGLRSFMTQIGNSLIAYFSASVGVHSPSTRFAEIGGHIVQGLANGIQDHMIVARNAIIKMGADLLASIKGFFGIHSPSTVARDEVGRFIVRGIADGITEDMSAEEAASKKAQNIINAFKSEFEKFSLDATTADLEYNLWEALNPDASEAEINEKKTELLVNKLKYQAERVNLANVQYQATLEQLGETAEETQQAYNTYLQEQTSMAQLASQLLEIQNTQEESSNGLFSDYADYIKNNYENLKNLGFSDEEVKKAAEAVSGWHQPELVDTKDIPDTVASIMEQFVDAAEYSSKVANGKLEIVYEDSIVNAVDVATESGKTAAASGGKSISSSLGDGLVEGIPSIENSLNTVIDQVKTVFTDGMDDAANSGVGSFLDGWHDGFRNLGDKGLGVIDWFSEKIFGKSVKNSESVGEASGATLITEYGNAIADGTPGASDATANAIEVAGNAGVEAGEKKGTEIGNAMMQGVINGTYAMIGGVSQVQKKAAGQILQDFSDTLGIHSPSREYYAIAEYCMVGFSNGMMDSASTATNAESKVLDRVLDVASSYTTDWMSIGASLTSGLGDGLSIGEIGLKKTTDNLADRLLSSIRDSLDLKNNTSKEFYKIGKMIDQGLRNGIIDNASIVEGSISKLDKAMTSGIHPVYDYDAEAARSREKEDKQRYDDFYNQVLVWDAQGTLVSAIPDRHVNSGIGGSYLRVDPEIYKLATQVNDDLTYAQEGYLKNQELVDQLLTQAKEGRVSYDDNWDEAPQFNFTQINNSPKSLSRAEIYRDASNLFNQLKTSVYDKTVGKIIK